MKRIALTFSLVAAMALPATAQYSYHWDLPQQGVVSDFLVLHDFMTDFTNTSAVTDSFRVQLVKDMSPNWQSTLCEGPVCYPPFYVDHTFVLGPGESTNLDFAITPVVDPGSGSSIVTVTSLNDPGLTDTYTFTVISSGLDALLVDDAGGEDVFSYFAPALTGAGKSHATWYRDTMGKLSAPDLGNFSTVVWSAGTNDAGLDPDDLTALENYIQGGGNLFLNGQNLARAHGDPGSQAYTPAGHAFFQDVLRVDYAADHSFSTSVAGYGADPIFAGLVYVTTGGDGANNSISPDVLTVTSGGAPALGYGSGLPAGIRGAYGQGRSFFGGFSFEAISTSADRTELMDTIINAWLLPRFSAAPEGPPARAPFVPRAVPNPFNPRTTISFEISGSVSVPVEVVIHDARGRVVSRMDLGHRGPGVHDQVWDGRGTDGRNLPTGMYLATVRAGESLGTVKMTLTK